MLPDFTPEIALDKQGSRIYKILRPTLYGGAFLAGLYVASLVLFPSQYFTFSFPNANSNKNTLLNPRVENDAALNHGRFPEKKSVFFDAPVTEKYSSAVISFTLDPESKPFSSGETSLKKSFRAFFYPEGAPLGFKDGTLLQNDGSYFIVSDGQLRPFSPEAMVRLGFSKNNFSPAETAELTYNSPGKTIGATDDYPDGSLFQIADTQYRLEDGILRPFLSDQAYSSHYDFSQLLTKPEDFLKTYPLSEEEIGFADGTLLSSPDSIFIVSAGKILPVDSEITFLSNGFFWESVVSASSDEFSFYEKGKLFTLNLPHPDGTVFSTTDASAWYLVKNGQKLNLPSKNIMLSWTKNIPVNVSAKSLETSADCQLQKNKLTLRTYSCRIPLENLQNLLGKDFRFETVSDSEIKVDTLNARFIRDMNYDNFLFSGSAFFNRIKNHYAPIQ